MNRPLILLLLLALFVGACEQNGPMLTEAGGDEAVLAGAASARAAAAGDAYVLTAARWTDRQTRAVEAAGGTVTFSDEEGGIGLAAASAPDFIEKVRASNAFTHAARDLVVEWAPTVRHVDAEDTEVTPGDEGFFPYQWNMQAIEAPAAWAAGCTGAGVRVAVLDGGISKDHLDIAPNLDEDASASMVEDYAYYEDDDYDEENDRPDPFRHATHVAGIIAAADNGRGTIGVAPEATIVAVKVLHDGSGSFGDIIEGILYASTPVAQGGGGADIINMSLGAVIPRTGDTALLVAALNQAVATAARRGVLVLSSAGNDGYDLDHLWNYMTVPAESGNALAVSATGPIGWAYGNTDYRRFASYSNYGQSLVTVAAPGGDFALPEAEDPAGLWYFDMVLSPAYGTGSYSFAAGTSMASPAAAGVAALIVQQNLGISVGALKSRLAQTADDEGKPGHDAQYGRGFVNAAKACGVGI